jgi:hypothetical protein
VSGQVPFGEPVHRVAHRNLARLKDADVEPRLPRGGNRCTQFGWPIRVAKVAQGNPRRCHLEQRFPDPIAVSDPHRLGTEARQGQVLAERPRLEHRAELVNPLGGVLGAVDVDRLVGTPVVLHVRDDFRPAFTESTCTQRAAGSKRSLARFRLSGTRVG